MRDPRTLGPWLRRFLADYIVIERQLAGNTQKFLAIPTDATPIVSASCARFPI
jgi:hypothetical protein